MPKYVGRVEPDIWGNDRVVVRKEVSGGDVAAGAVDVAFNIGGAIISGFKERRREEKAQYAARQLEWAMQASEEGNYQGAIAEVTDVIRKYPGDSEPYTVRAQVHLWQAGLARNQGKHAERDRIVAAAIADLNKVIRIDGDDVETLWMRASAYMLGEAYDYALADANMCAKMNPKDAPTHLLKSKIFLELDDNEQALMSAQRALQEEPNSATYLGRGIVYYYMEDYKKALADFTRAITLDRTNTQAHEARAETYKKLGQDEAATADMRAAGISPQTPPVTPQPAPVVPQPNSKAHTAVVPSNGWPPNEEVWAWCEIEMGPHPIRGDNALVAEGRRYGRTRLVAYTPPLSSETPTPHTLGELAALEKYLKQQGWEFFGKGTFWYSLRFKHAMDQNWLG